MAAVVAKKINPDIKALYDRLCAQGKTKMSALGACMRKLVHLCYQRITAALCDSMAEPVNHKCVQRLMQKMGLRALIWARKRSWRVPGTGNVHVPNVLQRDFSATAPNQKWATDITEFNVCGQKLYLSACMDLYNGEIVSYRMARRPVFELVSGTLETALARAKSAADLLRDARQMLINRGA